MNIELNTKEKEIYQFVSDIFADISFLPDFKSVYDMNNEFVLIYWERYNRVDISAKIWHKFDSIFAQYYYYEKDFRNRVSRYIKQKYKLDNVKVWIVQLYQVVVLFHI